jgi:DNA polymerase I
VEIYNVNEVEADDVIASLAKKAERMGKEVVVVSTDRDFFQLIEGKTKVLVPSAEVHGLGEVPTLYDESGARAWLSEKFGVDFNPHLISDLKAIAGSTAKGIPGVKGIGEKGAAKLVHQYGTVDKIVRAIPKMEAGRGSVREKLEASLGNLVKSKELTTIRTNVRLNQFKGESTEGLKSYRVEVADTFFSVLGMKDLARKSRKLAESISATKVVGGHYNAADSEIVLDLERTEGHKAKPEPLFV